MTVRQEGAAMMDTVGAVVERAKTGDVAAWQELVGHHLGTVRAVCAAYGLNESDAAGVNQVVWLRLVEHLPRIRTPDAIGGWIAARTRRECLGRSREPHAPPRVMAHVGALAALAGGDVGAAVPPAPDLPSALARLGRHCQRLLRLVATEPRLPDHDISAALDIPLDRVRLQCTSCLERLRRLSPADDGGSATPALVWGELRRLVATMAQVPASWWDAAHTAFAWLVLDARSAELVYDSTAPSVKVVHAGRAAGRLPIRQLRFSLEGERVELALDTRDGELVVTGWVTPGRSVRVTVHWPGGQESVGSDDDGAFRLDHLPVAPLCVQVDGSDPFKTGWIIP
jgi:DNA-directed RNA polymerase specialized sigma24 family protein